MPSTDNITASGGTASFLVAGATEAAKGALNMWTKTGHTTSTTIGGFDAALKVVTQAIASAVPVVQSVTADLATGKPIFVSLSDNLVRAAETLGMTSGNANELKNQVLAQLGSNSEVFAGLLAGAKSKNLGLDNRSNSKDTGPTV